MVPPRHINADQQIQLGTITTGLLAPGTITADKLDLSVFGDGVIPNGTTGAIDINVDNLTLEINLDTLRVKSGGILPAHLNINGDLDFHNNQGLNFRLENVGSDPAAGHPGRLIWRTDLSEIHVDDGTSFIPLAGGSGVSSIHADSNPNITGNIQFVSGTNITLGQLGNAITITAAGGGHTIEDHSTVLPQRAILNFVGGGVTVTDAGTETQVNISTGTSTYAKDLFIVTNPLNHILTLLHVPTANSEIVGWNGLLLRPGAANDYTITGNTITLNAGINLTVGDEFLVVYAY